MYIDSEKQLRAIYGFPQGRAKDKQMSCLEKHAIRFISSSPFVLIASYGSSGAADVSPRGGENGLVKVISKKCLVIPDAKGNKRLDSLVNIIETGWIGCLFLVPGIDETLRINGQARVSTDPAYLELFSHLSNPPLTCIEVQVEEVFLHCAKALMRSRLWSLETRVERSSFPSMSKMLNDQTGSRSPAESQQDMIERYQKDL